MALKVYNHTSRLLEDFIPLYKGFVGMYVCGPTVYGEPHLGHAKVYVTFDIVHRYLEHLGYKVRYVQNITDVGHLVGDGDSGEDKIASRARIEQVEPMQIVETYTRHYFDAMDALQIIRPDISPRASGHIPEQIDMAQILIENNIAYSTDKGNVYFSVSSWPGYGKLSRKDVSELEEGARVEVSSDKRDPRDFAIWRAAAPGHLMNWKSPWGVGFPGWHAECTVMAKKYLGLPFDIHGGGLENIFPHNESEIAQAEAAYNQGFANYWLLNNMVTVEGKKMGKSLGNAINLSQLFSGNHALLKKSYNPLAVRFFILGSHYRQNTDFSDDSLNAAQNGYERLLAAVENLHRALSRATPGPVDESIPALISSFSDRFTTAMDADFNTPQALATIFDYTREVNSLLNTSPGRSHEELSLLKDFYALHAGTILGLLPAKEGNFQIQTSSSGKEITSDLLQLLIELRESARKKKDFTMADLVRNRLSDLGVELEDRKDGTVWKLSR